MSSFYGNVKSSPRSPFIFDRIYSSRTEMENALKVYKDNNNAVQGDGVFINRYVLVNYGFIKNGTYVLINPKDICPADKKTLQDEEKNKPLNEYLVNENNYTDYFYFSAGEYLPISSIIFNGCTREQLDKYNPQIYRKTQIVNKYEFAVYKNTSSPSEWISGNKIHEAFESNLRNDIINYNADYHLTVWMKIYMDNEEKYIMVAKLNPEAPAIEIRETSPAEGNSTGQLGPHWDLFQSSDINWVCNIPKHWEISLNTQDINSKNDIDNINSTTEITGDELPYFNKAGFDDKISNNTDSLEDDDPRKIDRIWLAPFKSGTEYPVFEFKEIELTPDTYMKNKYYIGDGDEKILSQNEWTNGTKYYIKTQKIKNNELETDMQYDQKRLSISLPSIGNAVSDLYDVLYGFNGFQVDRPYTKEQLFEWQNISPYNNLESKDKISMGWAMEEFKNYISELRFLAHGQGWRLIGYTKEDKINDYSTSQTEDAIQRCVIKNQNNFWLTSQNILDLRPYNEEYTIPVYAYDGEDGYNSYGLQSDWTLDDTNAFGYIYHRPRILWSNPGYISQDDESEVTNKGTETGEQDTDSYALHSIEYIFDHCMDETATTETLFGPSRKPLNRF